MLHTTHKMRHTFSDFFSKRDFCIALLLVTVWSPTEKKSCNIPEDLGLLSVCYFQPSGLSSTAHKNIEIKRKTRGVMKGRRKNQRLYNVRIFQPHRKIHLRVPVISRNSVLVRDAQWIYFDTSHALFELNKLTNKKNNNFFLMWSLQKFRHTFCFQHPKEPTILSLIHSTALLYQI